MKKLQLVKYPNSILKSQASPIGEVKEDLKDLVDEMFEVMYEAEGVGLAAPQVGLSKRIVVIDPTEGRDEGLIMFDPQVIRKKGEEVAEEGCLSLPGVKADVKRAYEVEVRYKDLKGEEKILMAQGLLARIIQHEMDHLEGILFIDKLSEAKRQQIMRKLKERRD